MSMRNLSLSDPPSRSSIWKLLAEAFGYFSGAIKLTDISDLAGFQESQVRFLPVYGHSHNGTFGSTLATTAIHDRVLDLNDCQVALGRYFGSGVVGSNIYAFLGGSGSCLLGSYMQISAGGTTYAQATVYGSTYVDYNPYGTYTGSNSLDVRALSTGYDSTNFSTNWSVVHVFPTMASTAASGLGQYVFHHHWETNTTGLAIWFAAQSCANATTISASSLTGAVYFDYAVLIMEL